MKVDNLLNRAGFEEGYESYCLEKDRELILAIARARGSAERRRGLLGRDCLPGGVALCLYGAPIIHSIGMRFAIDVAWIRGDRIAKTKSHWQPLHPPFLASLSWICLELRAGELKNLQLAEGDRVKLRPASQFAGGLHG